MICNYCKKDLKGKYFEIFTDKKGKIHQRKMCCFCRSEYWKLYNKKKKEEIKNECYKSK